MFAILQNRITCWIKTQICPNPFVTDVTMNASTDGETLYTAETTFNTEDDRYTSLMSEADYTYENVAAEEEINKEQDVEDYLAAKFATSRERFESPELEEPIYDEPIFDEISDLDRAGPSLTKVRSNTGNYMSMDKSNSSRPSYMYERNRSNYSDRYVPHSHVHKHPYPSPEFAGARPKIPKYKRSPKRSKTPLVIDMAHCFSPQKAPSFPRHSSPKRHRYVRHRRDRPESLERQRLLPEHWTVRPMIGGIQVISENPKKSPNKKHRSPHRRVSPVKTTFRSGISYKCNHALE